MNSQMPTREPLPTDTGGTAEHIRTLTSTTNSGLVRYLVTLVAVSLVLYPLPFYLVRVNSYPEWNRGTEFRPMDFSFTVAGQNADVVIFGDSSAYHGINPRQMSAALGANVLVMPSNLGVLDAIDDLALRRYMQADKPPRLIVFYFAPWNFDYRHAGFDGPKYDGMEMLMRHGTSGEIFSYVKARPLTAIQFPLMFYRANLNANIMAGETFRRQAKLLELTNGHEDSPAVSHSSLTCEFPSSFIDRIKFDWVRQMTEKYRTAQTKVLYFAAPIPECTNVDSVIERSSRMISAAPPRKMPISLFVQDNFYVHLYAAGVSQATQNLIEAVRPFLASSTR